MRTIPGRIPGLRAFLPSIVGLVAIVLVVKCRSHEAGDAPAPAGDAAREASGERPAVVGRIQDDAIVECSGLVAGRKNPGTFWAHNDSGGRPILFAMQSDGTVTHELEVQGADVTDWEDIACGPGPARDESYLYIADTGNNSRGRSRLGIYRIHEPLLRAAKKKLRSEKAARIVFEYERGRHDCEALVVHPLSGDIYLLTKFPILSQVYRIPRPALHDGEKSELLTATLVGSLPVRDLVTGADLSADGRRLAVRSYLTITEYAVDRKQPFTAKVRPRRLRTSAHRERQSEAICFTPDGYILTTSEGRGQPIYRLKCVEE